MAVLQDLSQAQQIIDALTAKLALATQARKLSLKVSKSGAISVYGMGRWPVTLYASQWDRVLDCAQEIKDFAEANAALLSTGKDDPRYPKGE